MFLWAVAKNAGGSLQYYADELPGTDTIRWVNDPADCQAYDNIDQAEMVRGELEARGHHDAFVTTVRV